jgi:hypothetical protein
LKNSQRFIPVLTAALALLLIMASAALADFSRNSWRYYKEVILPAGVRSGNLVELSPDAEIFAGAAAGLSDVRFITGTAQEIAYKLEISQPKHEQTSLSVSIRDKGYVQGSYTVFTADLGRAGILHNQIEFRSPADEFRRTATVEASNDDSSWMWLAEQTVYAFSVPERGFTTRNTAIRYPESTARYLRVKIADEGEGALEISGASVFYVKDTPAVEVPWPSSVAGTDRDPNQKTTNVLIDLGTPGLPSSHLHVDVPGVNFFREADVQSSPDRESWRTLVRGADLYNYDTPKFAGGNLDITYPETSSRFLRLVIHDEDNPPLDVRGVNVWGLRRRLVFTVDPQPSYRLYYGNEAARKPSYDIERIFPYLITEGLPEASTGPQTANPYFEEKKPPVSERFPWLFPLVIAAAAIIVAFLLFIVFRQVRKSLPPPQE